jgi:hypothetical protein
MSVFLAFPLVHLWWFAPAWMGYLPFFYRNLVYHPKLMKKIFWLMVLWPLFIIAVTAIDWASNLWVTKALFATVSATLSSIIALVAAVLPLLVNRISVYLNKVDVEVLSSIREKAIVIGYGEQFYESPKILQKSFPVVVKNRTRRAVVVSHILLGVTSLNIPLGFRTKSGSSPIEYEEEYTLNEWVVVQSESSQILQVPWKKVTNVAKKAEEIARQTGRRTKFFIGIYDPFSNRKFWSKKINHRALYSEFASLEWVKKHPEWGKE